MIQYGIVVKGLHSVGNGRRCGSPFNTLHRFKAALWALMDAWYAANITDERGGRGVPSFT
jgi:hypothetical protein